MYSDEIKHVQNGFMPQLEINLKKKKIYIFNNFQVLMLTDKFNSSGLVFMRQTFRFQ